MSARLVWTSGPDGIAHAARAGFARTLCDRRARDPRWGYTIAEPLPGLRGARVVGARRAPHSYPCRRPRRTFEPAPGLRGSPVGGELPRGRRQGTPSHPIREVAVGSRHLRMEQAADRRLEAEHERTDSTVSILPTHANGELPIASTAKAGAA